MTKESRRAQRKKVALASGDPNRILRVWYPRAAAVLFDNNLNALSANRLSDEALLCRAGIGKHVLWAVRQACRQAQQGASLV